MGAWTKARVARLQRGEDVLVKFYLLSFAVAFVIGNMSKYVLLHACAKLLDGHIQPTKHDLVPDHTIPYNQPNMTLYRIIPFHTTIQRKIMYHHAHVTKQ